MSMDTYALLEGAIERKEQVRAEYDGLERAFCPHALGRKGGEAHVLAFQFAGGSKRGLPRGGDWRCFVVAKLGGVSASPGPWHSAPNVFNPQSCLDEIDAIVQPFPPIAARAD
jgi:hypothetical protein